MRPLLSSLAVHQMMNLRATSWTVLLPQRWEPAMCQRNLLEFLSR